VIKGRHEVGRKLSRFLFGYGVGRILFTGLKKRTQAFRRLLLRLDNETVQPPCQEPPAETRSSSGSTTG